MVVVLYFKDWPYKSDGRFVVAELQYDVWCRCGALAMDPPCL